MAKSTHLVKLRTDSDPFYAKAVWDKDQREAEVLLLQKDKAWNIVLNNNDMDAVAKKLQVGSAYTSKDVSLNAGLRSGALPGLSVS